jgi:hypothetical protein
MWSKLKKANAGYAESKDWAKEYFRAVVRNLF